MNEDIWCVNFEPSCSPWRKESGTRGDQRLDPAECGVLEMFLAPFQIELDADI